MLFNPNHTINTGNYEEYFILYMDNELSAEQKRAVENFISQHPHLQEELDLLMSAKLPLDETGFAGKEDLLSSSMKINTVDESLLLYIDHELAASQKKVVEEKIRTNKDYALQYAVLMQTKLDASEEIVHPNKKELYRHTERVVVFKLWMRVAAAAILVLFASIFFLTNRNEKVPANNEIVNTPVIHNIPNNKQEKEITPVEQLLKQQVTVPQEDPLAKASTIKATNPVVKNIAPTGENKNLAANNANEKDMVHQKNLRPEKVEAIQLDLNRLNKSTTAEPIVNKTITRTPVTSKYDSPYNNQNNPMNNPEADWAVTTEKKTPAKGFFRKVSRFIERNTGIGTVNADNELLIGAVALKLK